MHRSAGPICLIKLLAMFDVMHASVNSHNAVPLLLHCKHSSAYANMLQEGKSKHKKGDAKHKKGNAKHKKGNASHKKSREGDNRQTSTTQHRTRHESVT